VEGWPGKYVPQLFVGEVVYNDITTGMSVDSILREYIKSILLGDIVLRTQTL
jgi:hypothetical protein